MFHVKHPYWERVADATGFDLPAGAGGKLSVFAGLLREEAVPRGAVGPGEAPVLRERHIADALRAARLIDDHTVVADLGSGAGLPGVPLAIVRPGARFILMESRRQRAAFLEVAAERLSLGNVTVYPRRAETSGEVVDVCLARAFGDIAHSWAVAEQLLAPKGRLLYWAGHRWDPSTVDLPVLVTVAARPTLANRGPIVIMSRQ